jgi:hypothetical protein
MIYKKLVNQFLPYAQKQLGFNKPPIINFLENEQNATNPLGDTGNYNPSNMEITVYVTGRHPKDILRSVSHELVHHAQNCRGEFTPDVMGEAGEGYAQKSPLLRRMEEEANMRGNMLVRDWTDNKLYKESLQQKGTKQMIDLDALTDAIMNKIMEKKESCKCGKSHKGMTCDEYANKEELKESEKPLNYWLNDERYNLLMNRFGISEKKKEVKNPGPYKTGMKKGYDDDGDGVPDGADKDSTDGSIKEKKLAKQTLKKGHEIAKAIEKEDGNVDEPYAVGMAKAKEAAKKGKK